MEANGRERHGTGKNVYGNMVTNDLKGSQKIPKCPMVLGILWVPLNLYMGTWLQKIPKDPTVFGNTVGYLECLNGNMVTKDPQRSHGFGN